MGGVLHIVCGAFAAGTLRAGLQGRRGETVAAFQCGLRYGALFRDFGDAELYRYAAEVERLTGCVEAFEQLRAFVGTDFGRYDKVAVWHGGNVDETLMYYMVCALAAAAPLCALLLGAAALCLMRLIGRDGPRETGGQP